MRVSDFSRCEGVALVEPRHRVFEPEDAVGLAEASGAHGGGQVPSLVGVQHDRDVGPDRLADDADALGVGLGRQPADLHLHRAIAVLQVQGRLAPQIVRALAVAIVEARHVGGHPVAERAAQERVDGAADRLALEVPERDVDGAHRGHERALLLPGQGRDAAHRRVGEREEILPDALGVERIVADDQRGDRVENLLHAAQSVRALLEQERAVTLADADVAGVRGQPDDHLAHPADRGGGRPHHLRQRRREEIVSRPVTFIGSPRR